MQNMTVETTLKDIEYLHTGWKRLSPQDKAIKTADAYTKQRSFNRESAGADG